MKARETIAVLLFSLILGIGIISATPLSEFMSSTSLTVQMTQTSTTDTFTLNTAGTSFDAQTVSLPNGGSFPFRISDLLGGVNQVTSTLNNGAYYPVFSQVNIASGSLAQIMINTALTNYLHSSALLTGDSASDSALLTSLAQANPSSVAAVGTTTFSKNGNTYTVTYSGAGYGNIPEEYRNQIVNAIKQGVNSVNLNTLVQQNLVLLNQVDSYLPLFNQLGYHVTSVDLQNALLQNSGYTVSVDLTNTALEDGTYIIPVTITPLSGDTTPIVKNVGLVLSGIINSDTGNSVDSSGTYTPRDLMVLKTLSSIKDISSNVHITSLSVQDSMPSGVIVLSNTRALKYVLINVDNEPTQNATIYFSIPVTEVSADNVGNVFLYHWDNGWIQLPTNDLGTSSGYYTYSAVTTGFSPFMIAEYLPPQPVNYGTVTDTTSSGNGATSSPRVVQETLNNPTTQNTPSNEPINAGNTAPVTGNVVGNFIKSGAGIVTIIVVLAVLIGTVAVAFTRKKK